MSKEKLGKKLFAPLKKLATYPFSWIGRHVERDLEHEIPVHIKPGMHSVYKLDFTQDGERFLKHFIWIQRVLIVMILALFPFYLNIHQKENRYFPTTIEGRLVPDVELSEPNIEKANLASWVSSVLTKSMSIGYHDYNRRLRSVSGNYTRNGWQEFTNFLEEQRLFRQLNRDRALMQAVPRIAPILEEKGIDDTVAPPRYYWRLEVRYRLDFLQTMSQTKSFEILVTVVRVPKLENGIGIAIDGWRVLRVKE